LSIKKGIGLGYAPDLVYTLRRRFLCISTSLNELILWVDFSNGFQRIVVGETCIALHCAALSEVKMSDLS
jgi:hypothetical protein